MFPIFSDSSDTQHIMFDIVKRCLYTAGPLRYIELQARFTVFSSLTSHDLELEFKPLTKKAISAKCGLKIKCEFIKEGSAM